MNATIPQDQTSAKKHVAFWLFACCVMISLMVLIGGLTRLTESGLSMTDWKPVTGWLPPIGEEAWQAEFDSYRQSPEYQHKNFGFSLAEFQNIFWLEYIHRVLGRITGLVFFLPFIYFLVRKQLQPSLILKLCGILLLGASQGIVGWFMVKSGLRDNPFVSPVWLSAHLGMAFLIFALVFWLALRQWHENSFELVKKSGGLMTFAWFVLVAIYIQTLLGGMVAGSDAGLAYNTWPDMNGKFIPDGLMLMQPWYANILQNVTTIQFTHRIGAYAVSVLIIMFAFALLRKGHQRLHRIAYAFIAVLALQMTLGIKTLLYAVPISLASAHQMVALLLFSVAIYAVFRLYSAQE